MKSRWLTLCLLLCMPSLAYAQETSKAVQSPRDFLGCKVGADFKLASWSKIVEHFQKLGESFSQVNTREIGKSTEGRPFLLLEISSAKKLKNREALIRASRPIADPRKMTDQTSLLKEAKLVIGLACSSMVLCVRACSQSSRVRKIDVN